MADSKEMIVRSGLVAAALLLGSFLAWIVTYLIFSYWTSSGDIYSESVVPNRTPYVHALVPLYGEEEFYMRRWITGYDVGEYDIYLGGTPAATIVIGPIESVTKYALAEYREECQFTDKLGYAIFWQFSGTATRNLRNLLGSEAATGCKIVAAYSSSLSLFPYARDVNLEIPKGGLSPLVSLLIDRGMKGLNTTADTKVVDAMNSRLVDEISSRLRLDSLKEDIKVIAFLYGPIQFATLFLLSLCIVILLISLIFEWARPVTEGLLDLIPYVGFFGTLLGMGAALSILGDANLSDPISKAINLGPIGSKLSLAIETTKFALVCFGLGTVFVLIRDVIKYRGEARPNPLISL